MPLLGFAFAGHGLYPLYAPVEPGISLLATTLPHLLDTGQHAGLGIGAEKDIRLFGYGVPVPFGRVRSIILEQDAVVPQFLSPETARLQGRELLQGRLVDTAAFGREPGEFLVTAPRLIIGPQPELKISHHPEHLQIQIVLPLLADALEQAVEYGQRRGLLMILHQRLTVLKGGLMGRKLARSERQLRVQGDDPIILAVVEGLPDLWIGGDGGFGGLRCRHGLELGEQSPATAFEILHILLIELQEGIAGQQLGRIKPGFLEQPAVQGTVTGQDVLQLLGALKHFLRLFQGQRRGGRFSLHRSPLLQFLFVGMDAAGDRIERRRQQVAPGLG